MRPSAGVNVLDMQSGGAGSGLMFATLAGTPDQLVLPDDLFGESGVQVFYDGSWLNSIAWLIEASYPTFMWIYFEEAIDPAGLAWRFTEDMTLTIAASPLAPRSGIVSAEPEGMAAKIADVKALTGLIDKRL